MLYKNRFRLKKLSEDINSNSFEFADCVISYLSTTLQIVVVYRPPPSRKNHLNVTVFLEEFSSFLERIVTTTRPLIIIGDYNFHLDNKNDRSAARFKEQLDAFSLVQHVRESTHKSGHTLDLVITRVGEETVRNVRVTDPAISDHCAVHCETLCLIKPSFEKREVSYRKLRSLDNELLIQDILKATLMNHGLTDVKSLVNCYYKTLRSLLDKHAPEKSRIMTIRPAAPWCSDTIKREKAKRRKLERIWRKDKLAIHRELYVEQCARVNTLIHESKMQFYANVIDENVIYQQILFSAIGKMLNLKTETKLPSHDNECDLANRFAEFFSKKVQRIRTSLPPTTNSTCADTNIAHNNTGVELSEFSPTSVNELSSLLKSISKKSCSLDPIPATVMKACYDTLLPVNTDIVNLSLENASVPTAFKQAVVDPILKKDSLDHEIFKNFSPISNLSFISKATGKVVAERLNCHLENANLHETFQSAYKKDHSTETALARIYNDILCAPLTIMNA